MQKPASKRKARRLKLALSRISPHTIKLLNYLLFIIMIEFLWSGISFYIKALSDPLKAVDLYSSIFEHLLTSLLLSVGFGVLFDISISEINKK